MKSKVPFSKTHKKIDEQIEILQERKLLIPGEDIDSTKASLKYIGYFRLIPYMRYFQYPGSTHTFKEKVTFRDIVNLYCFDRELRIFVFDIIEKIEIALRAQISYSYSINFPKSNPWWYENDDNFDNDPSQNKVLFIYLFLIYSFPFLIHYTFWLLSL